MTYLLPKRYARPIVSGNDSDLRKGIIIALVNNNSSIGKSFIDDAFRGNAPRLKRLKNCNKYIYGSIATNEYIAIARHDYLETGKTFPPSYVKGPPFPDEANQWRKFINTFPWFPGTDDAYYRMAYNQYASGETDLALTSIQEFLSKEFLDDDARPLINYLLQILSLTTKSFDKSQPTLWYLRTLVEHPIGQLMFDTQPDIKPFIIAIDWFLNNPKSMSILNTNKEGLKAMHELAEIIRTSAPPNRFRLVTSFLKKSTSSGFNITGILYSKFFTPLEPQDSHFRVSPPVHPGNKAMEWVANRLANEISSKERAKFSRDEITDRIALILLHFSNLELQNQKYFDQAFKLASTFNGKDLPPEFQKEHQKLVSWAMGGKK